MNNFSNYHFFLGGHDAEMEEIGKILSANGCLFEDAELQWDNAKLSVYKEKLAKLLPDEIPVLIELEQDIPAPERAKVIDHHGKLAGIDKKTSIEQIADLLKIKLTRHQQLISANDRGHIRGMLAIGVKPEEIEPIRKMDRDAQKITEEDYRLADEAIANIETPFQDNPGIALIKSKTKRSAAIIDKIWNLYQTIIIQSPDDIFICGQGNLIEALKNHYDGLKENCKNVKYWFGGMLPIHGYFGSTNAHYDEKEILKMAKKETKPVSQHVFLFPFLIKYWDEEQLDENEKKLDWSNILASLEESGWHDEPNYSPFSSPENYSEYAYFHEYVRKAIFNGYRQNKQNWINPKSNEPQSVSHLMHRNFSQGEFEIRIHKREYDKTEKKKKDIKYYYNLIIENISLRLYKTGVAILSFDLLNYKYCDFDDIQRINDFGRRVYPQFLSKPSAEALLQRSDLDYASAVKNNFLTDCIRITLDQDVCIEEHFRESDFFKQDDHLHHLHIGNHIIDLVGKDFTETYKIEPIIDDRMFTLCWYRGDELLTNLTTQKIDDEGHYLDEYSFEDSEDWYRFIFVDGGDCCCPDEQTRRSLIATTTYRRWNQYSWGSTLFGISRYSFVCMSGDDNIRMHMKRHYRLMAELLLVQRASIIIFSIRVSSISRDIDDIRDNSSNTEDIAKRVCDLYGDFIGFVNRLWFSEITPQEQGIEMYDMAMKNMNMEKQMAELKDEINELNKYVEMQTSKITNTTILKLTVIAALALPISITLAFWGVSKDILELIQWNFSIKYFNQGWWTLLGSLLFAVCFGLGLILWARGELGMKKIINCIRCLFRGRK